MFGLRRAASIVLTALYRWRLAHRRGYGLVKIAARLGLSIAFALLALFPNAPRLADQLSRIFRPEQLVDPYFPGSDEAVEGLLSAMALLPPGASLADEVKAVNSFVRSRIAYARDWDLYGGNLHDWPKPEEVWQRGSDDCDGIAILNASLLRRLGIEAVLEYNIFHCWVRVGERANAEGSPAVTVGGAIDGPTASRADGGTDWIRLAQDFFRPRTWTEGLTFPLWRIALALLAGMLPWALPFAATRSIRTVKRISPNAAPRNGRALLPNPRPDSQHAACHRPSAAGSDLDLLSSCVAPNRAFAAMIQAADSSRVAKHCTRRQILDTSCDQTVRRTA